MKPWLDALRAIDGRGDESQLVKLLKSDVAIPPDARQHLADLLERYQLKLQRGGRGGRRTPSYDLPHHVVQLEAAARLVRGCIKAGKTRADAVKFAIANCGRQRRSSTCPPCGQTYFSAAGDEAPSAREKHLNQNSLLKFRNVPRLSNSGLTDGGSTFPTMH
jgi:hypothetical protein